MTAREMSAREVHEYFGDMNRRGLIVDDADGPAGWLGFYTDQDGIYVHSLYSGAGAYPMMAMWIKGLADELSLPVKWVVAADNTDLLHLVKSGRAAITDYVIVYPAKENRVCQTR